MTKAGMGLVGLLLFVRRALPGVLDSQCAGNHQHFLQAACCGSRQDHARQAWVYRQAGHIATYHSQFSGPGYSAQFFQELVAVAHHARVWRVDKREILHLPQAQYQHLQHHRRQVGAHDLRIGKRRPQIEIRLAVKAQADARSNTTTAPLSLVGTGL